MRFSRLVIIVLIVFTVLIGANCSYYNRIIGRKNLVDGATAYKERKFEEAEKLFRVVVKIDPEAKTMEGKTAQLFLARTLHSEFIANRLPTFEARDFLGDQGLGLARKILAKADPVSEYLQSQLTPDTQRLYEEYTAANPASSDLEAVKAKDELLRKFKNALAIDLNKLIIGPSIYDSARFGQTNLSDNTKELLAQQPTGYYLARLNRQLLEDSYPNEIAKKADKAGEAIETYRKVLIVDANDQGSFKAIASLLDNIEKKDESLRWVTERSKNADIKAEYRAEAFTSLAARQYSCANGISDIDPVKKTVKKDGKDVYQFTKPEKQEDFDKLKSCTEEGIKLVDQSLANEPDEVKTMKDLNLKSMTVPQINEREDLLKIFSSAWSYKANLLYQKMRIAEMENNTADKDSFKAKGDEARTRFTGLNEVEKNMEAEKDERKKAAEEKAANKK